MPILHMFILELITGANKHKSEAVIVILSEEQSDGEGNVEDSNVIEDEMPGEDENLIGGIDSVPQHQESRVHMGALLHLYRNAIRLLLAKI